MENYVMNESSQWIFDTFDHILTWEDWVRETDGYNCDWDHKWEYRYHIGESGRISLFNQCTQCGKRHGGGSSLKHDTVPNLKEKINLGEINKYDLELLNKKSSTYENYNAYYTFKREANKQLEKANRTEFYNEYIKSDKWKAIRLKVLKRDNNLCQACLEAPAQDVHHITYENIGDELMYELLSVCRDCHFNRIHKHRK